MGPASAALILEARLAWTSGGCYESGLSVRAQGLRPLEERSRAPCESRVVFLTKRLIFENSLTRPSDRAKFYPSKISQRYLF